ncbi:MAG: hypothetical protein ACE5M4_14855, partial [Anaerolineales bacterium]
GMDGRDRRFRRIERSARIDPLGSSEDQVSLEHSVAGRSPGVKIDPLTRARSDRLAQLRSLSALPRFIIVFGLMWLVVWIAYVGLDRPTLGTDDAHIFFVYADNLKSGEGVVYNPGGERVEGYSSPLWMLIVTGAFVLFDNPERLLLVLSVSLVSGAITVLWGFVDGSKKVTLAGLLFLAWVISSPSFVIWTSLSLMDTALWSSLVMLGAVVAVSKSASWRAALIFSLILLARPEGMLWALVLIGVSAVIAMARAGIQSAWRSARIPLVAYAVVAGALIGLRLVYFGYPLPNTYYAKMSTDLSWNLLQGARYLATFVLFNWHVLLIGIGPAIAVFLLNTPRLLQRIRSPFPNAMEDPSIQIVPIAMIGMAAIFTPVIVGGDHFDLSRFYQALWPLFFLYGLGLFGALRINLNSPARYIAAAIAVVAFLLLPRANWLNQGYEQYIRHEFRIAEDGKILGTTLMSMFHDGLPSIGVITAGGIALEYEGTVVDVMGLNNVSMAHSPGDRRGKKSHAAFNSEVFLEQSVDLLAPMTGPRGTLYTESLVEHCLRNTWLKGMLENEQFLELYQPAIISDTQQQVLAYVDRDFLADLDPRGLEFELLDYPKCS